MIRLPCLILFFLISLTTAKQFGIPAYWGKSQSSYSTIPAGAYAILNPMNGALNAELADKSSYKKIISNLKSRGVRVLGYIPTGYNQKGTCVQRANDIGKEISAWQNLGNIDGYFFDEAAYESSQEWCTQSDRERDTECAKTKAKWSRIRSLAGSKVIVWNSGMPGPNNCMVTKAANRGEHVVISEDEYNNYNSGEVKSAATAAKQSGVKTWVLVYHADSETKMKSLMSSVPSDFIFITDKVWEEVPIYWDSEKSKL